MNTGTRIIFLDIDGVLNFTGMYIARKELGILTKRIVVNEDIGYFKDHIDLTALGLLMYIVKKTDAKIVISSSWRIGKTKEWFIEGFKWLGWKKFPIVDMTIVSTKYEDLRGDEINEWLESHPGIKQYIILDDSTDFYSHQNFYKLDLRTGLTYVDAENIIRLLGGVRDEDEDETNGYCE